MDWTTILSSLISGVVAIVVCVINNRKTMALIEYKIEQLTERVEKHNNLIERTYKNETDIKVLQEKVKVENHRVSDLEDVLK